ncbi:hypothetical protein XELAEV_18038326mg [Xenopus laevis]|uniref:Uncharacterized protein n=1 Tax=Xenopus laevis TaxID=8355 RepID=A0A974C5U0_XENLA|nr:hypothetical protein XELAEV_18038326mg [Xenopus laevis]
MDLVRAMKQDVDKLRLLFGGVVTVWSEIMSRITWRWARDMAAMERSRQKLNKLLSAFIRQSGGIVVRHKVLESRLPGYFSADEVHLSAVGTDIFNLDLSDGIERALLLMGGGHVGHKGHAGMPMQKLGRSEARGDGDWPLLKGEGKDKSTSLRIWTGAWQLDLHKRSLQRPLFGFEMLRDVRLTYVLIK